MPAYSSDPCPVLGAGPHSARSGSCEEMHFLPNHPVPQRPCPHSQQTTGTRWSPPGTLWTHFPEELAQDLGSEHSGGSRPFRPVTLSAFPRGAPCPSPRSPHPPVPMPMSPWPRAFLLPGSQPRHPQPWGGGQACGFSGSPAGYFIRTGKAGLSETLREGGSAGAKGK